MNSKMMNSKMKLSMKRTLLQTIFQVAIISHYGNLELANAAKKYLHHKQHIPNEMISVIEVKKPCVVKNVFIHLCINGEKNLEILRLDAEQVKEIFEKYK